MRARVMQLWQTRLLRFTKLTVADEIENALSYYRRHLPARRSPSCTASSRRRCPATTVAPFFRMGNWIGGDRDGNPNVSAETLRLRAAHASARRRCATTSPRCTSSAPSCRCSATLVAVTPEMQALADASPRHQRAPRATSPTGAP